MFLKNFIGNFLNNVIASKSARWHKVLSEPWKNDMYYDGINLLLGTEIAQFSWKRKKCDFLNYISTAILDQMVK